MRRSFRFRLRPTAKQQIALVEMLGAHCDLYNAALQERRDAYQHVSRTSVRYGDQSAQLKEIRRADPEGQGKWGFSSQQATLRRLNKAFDAFFRRVKAGQTPGYPRFKGRGWFDSVEFPADGDGIRWNSLPDSGQTRVRIQGVGHVRVHAHRQVRGAIKTLTVKREGTHWYLVLSCDGVPEKPLPNTGAVVGLDMATGDNGLAYTSVGNRLSNPRHLHHATDRLAAAQRHLSRTKRGSANRKKASQRVAALHRKVRNARLDHLHKQANTVIAQHDVIAVEALNTAGMTRRARAKPDPDTPGMFLPNGQSAKSGLNKSILDAGWGLFLNLLHAKAESAGRVVVEVPPAFTSQTCAECQHIDAASRQGKQFVCTSCGHIDDADINAARNILRAGLALYETAPAAE
jgi:putative transposase